MKITAVGIGTRGDVQPLIELGAEMKKRGHEYRVASFEDFRAMTEEKGLEFIHLDGNVAALTQYLITEYVKVSDFMPGYMKLYRAFPGILDQIADAVKGSDAATYGICSFFVRSACDLHKVPAVRIFFSPFDATNQYSLYSDRRNSLTNGLNYLMQEPGMNMLTMKLFNGWRSEHGLRKWTMLSDYRKQNGEKVLTFYPVSPYLMPPDPTWGSHIHVTGYWYHPDDKGDFKPSPELEAFLKGGEAPLFVGFGRAASPEMKELQNRTLEAIANMHVRAIFQGEQADRSNIHDGDGNIFYAGNVPYGWLYPRVRAVVHHGGCSTTGLGLRAGKPTLVMPLALDQLFYGRQVHELRCGPAPLYVRFELPTVDTIQEAIRDLISGKYDEGAKKAQACLMQERGCEAAADLLEKRFGKV
ncbi:MAG: glycosyltransferase [Clostridia bacterium]|nr:glycosyltransferase [Clostridia bacterium]